MSSTTGLASECGRDYFRTLTVVINGLSQRCAAGTAKEQAGAQRKDHGLVYGVCQFAAPIGPFQLRPPPGLTPQRSLARSRNEGGCWCPAPAAALVPGARQGSLGREAAAGVRPRQQRPQMRP